jgi:hypothetical protein
MSIAKKESLELINSIALFRNSRWYAAYPITKISPELIELFNSSEATKDKYYLQTADRFLKVLDCYLCVTGQYMTVKNLESRTGSVIFYDFIGAIYSETFYYGDLYQRYILVAQLRLYIVALSRKFPKLGNLLPRIAPSSVSITPEIAAFVSTFEARVLDSVEVKIWRGWPIQTRGNVIVTFDLRPIFIRYGNAFTDALFDAIQDCAMRTRAVRMDYIPLLVHFLSNVDCKYTKSDFIIPHVCSRMWREFLHFFVETRQHTSQYKTTACIWRTFRYFWNEHLSKIGIFANDAAVPYLPPGGYKATHITLEKNGVEISQKLLTDVPLHVSDREAIELLFRKIQSDIDIVERWALAETNDIWARYLRRRKFEVLGKNVKFPAHKKSILENSEGSSEDTFLMNASAALSVRGFQTSSDDDFNFPVPYTKLAFDLGLPRSDDLLPHMALLVIDHPMLTSSFFTQCELFDLHGQMVGFEKRGEEFFLNGFKHRRGAARAYLSVKLTERARVIVEQIIALTEPLRKYLKKQGDDSWRRLFLTCHRGFGYPTLVNPPGSASNSAKRKKLESSFSFVQGLQSNEVKTFVSRFSLATLRASIGAATYVKNPDVRRLALTLGHIKYDHRLVARYLPEPLLRFFQQRWIRLFQISLIAEALKESDSLLYATGLKNMDEVHEFLTHHALNVGRKNAAKIDIAIGVNSCEQEFIFSINEEVLTVMLKIIEISDTENASLCPLQTYWAAVSKNVLRKIEEPGANREDLIHYLHGARANIKKQALLGEIRA